MKPLLFHLPGDEDFADRLVRALQAERATLALHRFPDGESLVRLDADVTNRIVVLTCSLARPAGAPWIVLSAWRDRQPVLVDDIVSSARTMIQAVASVRRVGLPAPLCIGVHALFAPGAYEELLDASPARVLTCDTVPHASNTISVAEPMARALKELMEGTTT